MKLRRLESGSDHPRSRGEYLHRAPVRGRASGSSPLSRGIPTRYTLPSAAGGIIPALAGNTERLIAAIRRISDHPRSRGEYIVLSAGFFANLGSSPLSRGIRVEGADMVAWDRIIPALAGNT